jgi:glycerol-3-phosphate dehydrogenase
VIDHGEIDYLCAAANLYFTRQIEPADIVNTWSGIRPLYNDGANAAQDVTRDYVLELDTAGPPILSVFGGKITTARHLAEDVVAKLSPTIGKTFVPATRSRPLPGGDIDGTLSAFTHSVLTRWPWLGAARAARMARSYGSLITEVIGDAGDAAAMGTDFGGGLTAREVDWLITREWASCADDILWRRTKLGLVASDAMQAALTTYMKEAIQ